MVMCEICGTDRHLDRHHVIPRHAGGTNNTTIHSETNLITLCRDCHRNLHEGRWKLSRSQDGIRVLDAHTGRQVMRRLYNRDLDIPSLLHSFNNMDRSLSLIFEVLPFLSDDQLTETFGYASALGKRSWLLQAAVLYEAQQRSIYGERSLEAVARRFDMGLRQAEKYALVWKVFFSKGDEEFVNIDEIALDEPSWYLVAASETKDPEKWLSYAQDRKEEDPRYSVAAFRRDIQLANIMEGTQKVLEPNPAACQLPTLEGSVCPWLRLFCVRSGTPVPAKECTECNEDTA